MGLSTKQYKDLSDKFYLKAKNTHPDLSDESGLSESNNGEEAMETSATDDPDLINDR